MKEPVYNSIGIGYNTNRSADRRITDTVVELLGLPVGATIADVGAGTGNYSNALARRGYRVIAVEPSSAMREQATPHPNVRWLQGTAESTSLQQASVDGVVIILAIHHFQSLPDASAELHRICPEGPVIIMTYDPRKGHDFWFNRYFPEIYENEFERFPPIDEVASLFCRDRWLAKIRGFALPADLADRNMHAGWNRPELYFDEQMRRNTSGFALASEETTRRGLERLRRDLESGDWDRNYGWLRHQSDLHTGFVFLKLADSATFYES